MLPNLSYKGKKVHNEPTEAYLFITKHIFKVIKIEKKIMLDTKRVKLDVDGAECVNKNINTSTKQFNL